MDEKKIYTDREVFEQIKNASRKQYIKIWQDFKNFTVGLNFEDSQPGEEDFSAWIKHLKKLSKNYKIEGSWLQKDIKLPMYHWKIWDIIFFWDNHFMSHFSGHFENASTFLTL
jgi:hypothetical protein